MKFKVLGVEHIAIATEAYEPVFKKFQEAFGMPLDGTEDVASQKVTTAFLQLGQVPIELLQPMSADSPISKFLEKRGNAIHHIAVRVDKIDVAIEEMKAKGFIFIDEKPRKGAHDCLTAFIHPKSFGGILMELVQR